MENKHVILHTAVILLTINSGACLESVLVGKLPSPLFLSHAFYDGIDSAYLFGGIAGDYIFSDVIQRYNLTSGKTQDIGKLPFILCCGAISDDGNGNPVIVGGGDLNNTFPTVLKYNLADESISQLMDLKEPLRFPTSTSDGLGHIYIFGGVNSAFTFKNNIIKYYIDQKTPPTTVAQLPEGIYSTTSVAFGNYSYVFGGTNENYDYSRNVTQFNPDGNRKVEVLENIFEQGFTGASAVRAGDFIYIVGGNSHNDPATAQIFRFDPRTNTAKQFQLNNFPPKLYKPSAFYAPNLNRIYIIGGLIENGINTDDIYYIQL